MGESVEHVEEVRAQLEAGHQQLQSLAGNGCILGGGEGEGLMDRPSRLCRHNFKNNSFCVLFLVGKIMY